MKILLLLITQNVGGVEKRFYNYCKYIADKTDNNYTVVVSRSLINSLGEIKFDNYNKSSKNAKLIMIYHVYRVYCQKNDEFKF